jgi:hypothetical protein
MSPLQIYLGVEREVRKFKDNIQLNTADITYWLNKALNEFIDTRYENLDKNEESKQDLQSLITSATPTLSSSSSLYDGVIYYTCSKPSDLRYIINERATVVVNSVQKTTSVKPIQYDRLNFKLEDPFSEFRLSFGKAIPFRYEQNGSIFLVCTTEYTILAGSYNVTYIKNPTLFTISDVETTTEYSVMPAKTHKELISIAARMIIENESNPRYQTVAIEEQKTN